MSLSQSTTAREAWPDNHWHTLVAWVMSGLLHGTLATLVLLGVYQSPRSVPVEPARTAGIMLVRHDQGERNYFDQVEAGSAGGLAASRPSKKEASREQFLPNRDEVRLDLAGYLPAEEGGDPSQALGPIAGAGQLTMGAGRGRGIAGSARTQVFGISAEGNQFLYVFDRSGSMAGFSGRPLAAAKAELVSSLNDLQELHQFQIIFYNERPRIFNPTGDVPRLVWADDVGRRLASQFVSQIQADGGTQHMDALRMALKLSPDVIFFLTDADEPRLSSDELGRIRRLNQGTTINTIEFGYGERRSSTNFLTRLAHQNGGQHSYVNIARLKK